MQSIKSLQFVHHVPIQLDADQSNPITPRPIPCRFEPLTATAGKNIHSTYSQITYMTPPSLSTHTACSLGGRRLKRADFFRHQKAPAGLTTFPLVFGGPPAIRSHSVRHGGFTVNPPQSSSGSPATHRNEAPEPAPVPAEGGPSSTPSPRRRMRAHLNFGDNLAHF